METDKPAVVQDAVCAVVGVEVAGGGALVGDVVVGAVLDGASVVDDSLDLFGFPVELQLAVTAPRSTMRAHGTARGLFMTVSTY
jgi:hypothetical protein